MNAGCAVVRSDRRGGSARLDGGATAPALAPKTHSGVAKKSFASDLNTVILAMLSSRRVVRWGYRRRSNATGRAGALSRAPIAPRMLEGSFHHETHHPRGGVRRCLHPGVGSGVRG